MMNPFSRALSAKHPQQGFTLIELMIALVIGLAVVLGAGKLFLIGLQGFRDVEALGNKQETINFAVNTLVRDVRRADDVYIIPTSDEGSDGGEALEVAFINNGEVTGEECENGSLAYHAYQLGGEVENEGYSLSMGVSCIPGAAANHLEPLVAGFSRNGFLYTECATEGVWRFGLVLYPDEVDETISCGPALGSEEPRILYFYAVKRNKTIL